MADSTIDLRGSGRKDGMPAFASARQETSLPSYQPQSSLPDNVLLSWFIFEYDEYVRGPLWFAAAGGVILILLFISIYTANYLFSVFIILATLILFVYIRRRPKEIYIAVTPEGIHVGERFYGIGEFASFWVFERSGLPRELSLETKKPLMPFLRIPLGEAAPDEVRQVFAKMLPEQEHDEILIDHVGRRLGM